MSFTVENMEFYLLVLVRISAFVMAAPFFNYSTISHPMKAAISIMLSVVMIQVLPVVSLSYTGVVGFSVLVLKEVVVGLILGFMCNVCFYIVSFTGQIIDMQMGLSMANMFDPTTNIQISVTGNIYNYFLMLLLVVTNMHYYIIRAITDSFLNFNVGQAVFRDGLHTIMIDFMANYFLIALRIVLPVFCCMLLIKVILGVMTKAAPQMNMFSVGIQIEVLVGVLLLILLVQTFPTVADFVFSEMKDVVSRVIRVFTP
ncbi:MAG: flagellar biosynthetic protein FliR [Lachnospiraceae bacterium]|nr:flagellar biosynthetic protein FliR [Lachnospiraceae bacterium]